MLFSFFAPIKKNVKNALNFESYLFRILTIVPYLLTDYGRSKSTLLGCLVFGEMLNGREKVSHFNSSCQVLSVSFFTPYSTS